jgi:hypothetical protein
MLSVVALVVASRWRVHRGSLAMLALLIIIVGTVTMTSLAGARRAGSVLERASVEARSADLLVAGPPGTAASIVELPEVDVAAPLAIIHGEVEGGDFIIYADPTGMLGTAINRPLVVAGRLPDPTVVEEIALSEPTAVRLDLGPGDRIRYRVVPASGHGEPQAGVPAQLELVVVGVTRDLDDAVAPSGARAYGSPAFARAMGQDPAQVDGYLVRLHAGVDLRMFEARARAKAPTVDLTVDDLSRELGKLREALDVLRLGLLGLGVISGVSAAVVLTLFIDRQVQLQTRMLLTLGALGCRRAGRAIAAAAPMVPIAVAGSLAAGVLSVVSSPLTSVGLAGRVEPDGGFRTDVPVVATGTALLTALVVFVTLASGWRAAGAGRFLRTARQARTARRVPSVDLPPAWTIGGRLALESDTGRSVRPALVTAVVGVAGITAAAVLGASLARTVDTPDRHGRTWHAVLAYPPGPTPAAADVFTRTTTVAAVAELRTGELIVDQTAIPALTLRPVVGAVGLRVIEGREPAAADEIVLGSATADTLGVDVGDELSGLLLNDKMVRVVGRATFPGSGFSLIRDGAWLTPAAFDQLTVNPSPPELVLRWAQHADPVSAPAQLETKLPGLRVIDFSARPREVEDLARTSWVPWALGALLAALGVISLLHVLLTTVARRGADLAVLRALGFRRAGVRAVLAAEAVTIAAIGLGLGVPLGILAGRLLWWTLAERLGVASDPLLPFSGLAALLLLILSVAAICSSLPAWLALRQPPNRALRVE